MPSCLLTILLLFSTAPTLRAATLAVYPPAPHRIDFQTFIIAPAERPGWRQVTAFVGFSLRGAEAGEGVLLLPVDGVPEDARAQAASLAQFDAAHTHGRLLEGAFLDRSLSQRNADAALRTGICLAGGPPAWIALAARRPLCGPELTAVVSDPHLTKLPPHRLSQARILIGDKGLEEVPPALRPAAAEAMAASSSRCVIAVFFQPGPVEEKLFTHPASSGIRVSFSAPAGRQGGAEALRMPMAGCLPPGPALTRIYVQAEAGATPGLLFDGPRASSSAQTIVARAMGAFGYSEECLREKGREAAAVRLDAARQPDGALTARLTAVSLAWGDPPCALFHRRALGRLGMFRVWAGVALRWAVWPFIAAGYLLAVWAGLRGYRWLAGLPPVELSARRFALLAALSPLATPFFAMGIVAGREPATGDRSGEGALSVLSPQEYQSLARLMAWLCASATYLLAVMLFVRLMLRLSYT